MKAIEIQEALQDLASEERAIKTRYFFKTGKGQYGEGDQFIGVTNPEIRQVAKYAIALPLNEVAILMQSPIHEERLCGAIILTYKYAKAKTEEAQAELYHFYMNKLDGINNWDLVDLSSYKIVGAYLLNKNRAPIFDLANSGMLWKERIAVVSTMAFIKKDDFQNTFQLAEQFLSHKHDLMHKAVGWMLREIGKRNQLEEEAFLCKHYHKMPRTMLRYAIERFEESLRQDYLKGRI